MIDELLLALFGEALNEELGNSRRAKLLVRVFFGLLGGALGTAGAAHFALRDDLGTNTPMRWAMIALFIALACFALFNIALGRRWRWPGVAFVLCFFALLASRLLLGP